MSLESVKQYFKSLGRENDIREFSQSSATVELAAQAVGTAPARIAKTLSFYSKEKDHAILIVTAGDMKIDNSKFKHFFGMKAKMLAKEDIEPVFPAAGSENSAIELTCSELENYTNSKDWIDVCKPMDQ